MRRGVRLSTEFNCRGLCVIFYTLRSSRAYIFAVWAACEKYWDALHVLTLRKCRLCLQGFARHDRVYHSPNFDYNGQYIAFDHGCPWKLSVPFGSNHKVWEKLFLIIRTSVPGNYPRLNSRNKGVRSLLYSLWDVKIMSILLDIVSVKSVYHLQEYRVV